jgi:hypothetical protein
METERRGEKRRRPVDLSDADEDEDEDEDIQMYRMNIDGKSVDGFRVHRAASAITRVEYLPGLAQWYAINMTRNRPIMDRLVKILGTYVPVHVAKPEEDAVISYFPWLFEAIPREMWSLFEDRLFLTELALYMWGWGDANHGTVSARVSHLLYKQTGTVDRTQLEQMHTLTAPYARDEAFRRVRNNIEYTELDVYSVHHDVADGYVQRLTDPDFPIEMLPACDHPRVLIACDEKDPCSGTVIYTRLWSSVGVPSVFPRKYAFQLTTHGHECLCVHGYAYDPEVDLAQVCEAVGVRLYAVITSIVMSYLVQSSLT